MKEYIPDTDTLKKKLKVVLDSDLTDFLVSTHSRRAELVGNRRYSVLAIFFVLAVVVALYLVNLNEVPLVRNILMGCIGLWLIVLLLSGRKWVTNTKLLAREMNMAMVPILTNTLDRMLMYTNNTGHEEQTKRLLVESKLLTVPDIVVTSDDMYSIFGGSDTTVRELHIHQIVPDKDGKTNQVELFKGVLVVAELAKTLEAETFISTDGDRRGFAHRTFWSDLMENGEVKETVLEWNDFENHLHVATNNPTAARELLTPVMMQVVYDWWVEHKLNMRVAFRGNKLFMLLPDTSIRINASTTSTKPDAVERYAWSIARPLWRSLLLIDEVRKSH